MPASSPSRSTPRTTIGSIAEVGLPTVGPGSSSTRLSCARIVVAVSESEHEPSREPGTPRDVAACAIPSLPVDGEELDDFGAARMRRVADGEIDEEQAIALALQHYRR